MVDEYFELGEPMSFSVLQNCQAIGFDKAIKKHPFVEFIRAVRIGTNEGIEAELKPEVPTYPVNDIRKSERICVIFPEDDNKRPDIFALRKDFPAELQHLNLTEPGKPKSLCLFEQDYREIRRWITPEQFLLRIFDWFHRAATGKQHLPDQPLEPFLIVQERVIFDPDIFARDFVDEVTVVTQFAKSGGAVYRARAFPIKVAINKLKNGGGFLALPIVTSPYHARVINHTPVSVAELHALLKDVSVDLIEILQRKTLELFKKGNQGRKEHEILLSQQWLLLVRLNKKRKPDGDIESDENFAFFLHDKIGDLGRKLGVLEKHNGIWAPCLGDEHRVEDINNSQVYVGRAIKALDKTYAKQLAGIDAIVPEKITVVGAGALGSHVIMNLARQGIGVWTVIDDDVLLPHNQTRYALSPHFEGCNKAEVIVEEIRKLLNNAEVAKALPKDVLAITKESEDMKDAITEAELIIDCSVSPAVSRHLALLGGAARRICAFLLRNGRELVVFLEGVQRKPRLDDVEVQFYIACAEQHALRDLLNIGTTPPVRYSGACRDVTTVLSQDLVCTHAGIVSQFIRNHWSDDAATIAVWEMDEGNFTISRIDIAVGDVVTVVAGDWEIRFLQQAIERMNGYRTEKLPNETGGVLLGDLDLPSKTIYVGTVLPSPPDSQEWPFTYIRGIKELKRMVRDMEVKSGRNIRYVGEWHSHPQGHSCRPSKDDLKALGWLVGHMSEEGYPGLLVIKGDDDVPAVLVGCA